MLLVATLLRMTTMKQVTVFLFIAEKFSSRFICLEKTKNSNNTFFILFYTFLHFSDSRVISFKSLSHEIYALKYEINMYLLKPNNLAVKPYFLIQLKE